MIYLILEYVLVASLALSAIYFVYLLKDEGIVVKEDYFGIVSSILNNLNEDEITEENIKKILECASPS